MDRSRGQSTAPAARPLAVTLALWLGAAWAIGTALSAAAWLALSPSAAGAAALAGVPTLLGIAVGIVAVASITAIPSVDPSVAILGSSIFRLMLATAAGLLTQQTAAVPARPFWLSFLTVFGCVLVAEVIASRRLLLTAPTTAAAPRTDAPKEFAR